MRLTSLLSSSVLFGHFLATEAVNPIFGAFITPACEACLDAAFESCPGDYRTREYAQCMCAGIGGEGGSMVNSCMAQHCDGSINEDTNVAIRRATYCVSILKEACSAEEQYLPASVYDRECSSSTIPTDTAMADATMAGTTTTGTARTAVTTPDSGLPSGNSLTAYVYIHKVQNL